MKIHTGKDPKPLAWFMWTQTLNFTPTWHVPKMTPTRDFFQRRVGVKFKVGTAVKAILARYSKLPTLIFDEIDTGVSGEIAIRMGEIMKEMSQTMQIFAITHLPQIAAKGNAHFKVFKSTIGDDTQSELKLLNTEERVLEIAQMLSGAVVSDSALNHAKSLLN